MSALPPLLESSGEIMVAFERQYGESAKTSNHWRWEMVFCWYSKAHTGMCTYVGAAINPQEFELDGVVRTSSHERQFDVIGEISRRDRSAKS